MANIAQSVATDSIISIIASVLGQQCADFSQVPARLSRIVDEQALDISRAEQAFKSSTYSIAGRGDQVQYASTKLLINELFVNFFKFDDRKQTDPKYNFDHENWFKLAQLLTASKHFYILHLDTQKQLEEATTRAANVALYGTAISTAALQTSSKFVQSLSGALQSANSSCTLPRGEASKMALKAATAFGATALGVRGATYSTNVVNPFIVKLTKYVNDKKQEHAMHNFEKVKEFSDKEHLSEDELKSTNLEDLLRSIVFIEDEKIKVLTILNEHNKLELQKDQYIQEYVNTYETTYYEPRKAEAIQWYNDSIASLREYARNKRKSPSAREPTNLLKKERETEAKEKLRITDEHCTRLELLMSEKKKAIDTYKDKITKQFEAVNDSDNVKEVVSDFTKYNAEIVKLFKLKEKIHETASHKTKVTDFINTHFTRKLKTAVGRADNALQGLLLGPTHAGGNVTRKNRKKRRKTQRPKQKQKQKK